jgi:hypothetical protein
MYRPEPTWFPTVWGNPGSAGINDFSTVYSVSFWFSTVIYFDSDDVPKFRVEAILTLILITSKHARVLLRDTCC